MVKKNMAKKPPYSRDDSNLPVNTMEVLRRRYLLKDDEQNVIETPDQMFGRVAAHVTRPEANYDSDISAKMVEEKFYQMMRSLEFMPNSPTLMNAGTFFGQLSACFVGLICLQQRLGVLCSACAGLHRRDIRISQRYGKNPPDRRRHGL